MKKAELLIHRISSDFISLFVYLYNIILIVSYINASYNVIRRIRRDWEKDKPEVIMKPFESKDYKAFSMFEKRWALVTAGTPEDFNTCTVSWGSMGNVWGPNGGDISTVTVYIHPARYTQEFMAKYDTFTVSFFPESQRKALGYLGSHSGRDEDKVANSGLTPVAAGDGVTFKEADLTFVCKKLYEHQFDEAHLADNVKEYYAANPSMYTQVGKDRWEPHYMYIGEVVEAIEG